MEWKALANLIAHEEIPPDQFDPNIRITLIVCEVCKNPYLELIVSNEFPIFTSDNSKVTLSIYHCPVCGHFEMDCIGTYGMPEALPDSVNIFAGHFFEMWFGLLNMAYKMNREDLEDRVMVRPYTKKNGTFVKLHFRRSKRPVSDDG